MYCVICPNATKTRPVEYRLNAPHKEIQLRFARKRLAMVLHIKDKFKTAITVLFFIPNRTPTVLLPLLSEYFPFMTKSSYLHEVYVKNLLQITTYLPRERAKILTIIIDRMTKIDVSLTYNYYNVLFT